ncbi:hypothetical protein [Mucilaginibacter agri]|uniref:Uncharacterized protein n=1 Tax=Mucilaginibacter agri TaxID=2695265 RepID=A0A966DRE8_9SPHI|nr:hypothetical protein [Mucilaginibacter agri]NCD68410.1 hypothetical protein [Mucilaginibacter agri]
MELQENDDYNEEPQDEGYDIEIYSKRAIWGFSIFFSTIFGGVLLMINLRAAGYKSAANLVLLFSILYTLLGSIALSIIGATSGAFAIIFNGIGAAILTEYFFNRYFPEEDYYPKSIATPLLISFLICIPIVIFMIYAQSHGLVPAK